MSLKIEVNESFGRFDSVVGEWIPEGSKFTYSNCSETSQVPAHRLVLLESVAGQSDVNPPILQFGGMEDVFGLGVADLP